MKVVGGVKSINQLLALIQLLDSGFPTGAFAHSYGLETLMQEGWVSDPETLRQWLWNYVGESLVPMEGPGVYWAWQWYRYRGVAPEPGTVSDLTRLDRRLTFTRLARESREGGIKVARRYLHMLMALYPDSGLEWYVKAIQSGQCFGHVAVIHGWIAAHLQQTVQVALETHFYMVVNGLVQAALRGMSMGQTDAQRVLTGVLPLLSKRAAQLVVDPPQPHQLYSGALHLEVAAMRHETLYSRLFMS